MGMLAHMMSKSVPWIQFATSKAKVMKEDSVKKYVQDAAEQVNFGLGNSNVYGQSVWFSKDGAVTGTAVSIPEEDKIKGTMHYQTVSPRDSYNKFDRFGNLMVYHRNITMSAIEAYDEFDKSKLPTELIRNAKGENSGDPFKEYSLIYAVYPNANPREGSLRSEDKKFKVFYVLKAQGVGKNALVQHTGTQMGPIIWAHGREPGTNYGVSIAADALTEGLQGNKLGELLLRMTHREADPVTEAPLAMKESGIQTNPGGRNWVPEKYIGHNAIREIFSSGNWPMTDAQEQRLHATLDDKFYVGLWDALMTMNGPQKTATEVMQIQGNKAVLLSPVSEDFENAYLKQIVDAQWVFEEQIARRMPDVPDILLEPENRQIDTVFIGPLNQLQRATMQTRGTVNALAVIRQIADMWPQSLIKINEMDLLEDAAIAQGMKQSLIKTDEEVKAILEANAAAAEAEQQTNMAIEGAKAAGGLTKAIEQDSILDQAAGAMNG